MRGISATDESLIRGLTPWLQFMLRGPELAILVDEPDMPNTAVLGALRRGIGDQQEDQPLLLQRLLALAKLPIVPCKSPDQAVRALYKSEDSQSLQMHCTLAYQVANILAAAYGHPHGGATLTNAAEQLQFLQKRPVSCTEEQTPIKQRTWVSRSYSLAGRCVTRGNPPPDRQSQSEFIRHFKTWLSTNLGQPSIPVPCRMNPVAAERKPVSAPSPNAEKTKPVIMPRAHPPSSAQGAKPPQAAPRYSIVNAAKKPEVIPRTRLPIKTDGLPAEIGSLKEYEPMTLRECDLLLHLAQQTNSADEESIRVTRRRIAQRLSHQQLVEYAYLSMLDVIPVPSSCVYVAQGLRQLRNEHTEMYEALCRVCRVIDGLQDRSRLLARF